MVIDDALLLDVLAELAEEPVRLSLERGEVYTTGSWYYRLSRAVHTGPVTGSLSRQLAKFGVEGQHRVQSALDRLPDTIGLISLSELVPVMRTLPVSRPLNMLNAEAIAAALVLTANWS